MNPGKKDSIVPEEIDVAEIGPKVMHKPPSVPVPAEGKLPSKLFALPTRGLVTFPGLMLPVLLESEYAQELVEKAQAQSGFIGLFASKGEKPGPVDPRKFMKIGVIARILKVINLPDGNQSAMMQGIQRVRIKRFLRVKPAPIVEVEFLKDVPGKGERVQAQLRNLRAVAREVVEKSGAFPEEFQTAAVTAINNIEHPGNLCDFCGAYLLKDSATKQKVLEALDIGERLEILVEALIKELQIIDLGRSIQEEIRKKTEKAQKEYFLREQIKIIRRELGEERDAREKEEERFAELIANAGMPKDVEERAKEELSRLSTTPVESSEYAVIRNYLDWLTSLPWSVFTKDNTDIRMAERILEKDHYGLEEVKERILEFLAVRKLKQDHKGPILCFVGPPGVGKTSMGKSVARALGRKFWRLSLGGMRDEAEIKGHRRTYVGAMPGRIIQALKICGSANPVLMLDEVDKIGQDFRGDPASALLEVLDPEQNSQFLDQYLDVRFDLSKVLFIATANVLDTIPPALRDRMEVIEIPGYLMEEKVEIARRHLIPRQLQNHGLKPSQLSFRKEAVREIIKGYTREAGVRGLEKVIAHICRKTALKISKGRRERTVVDSKTLEKYLGAPRFIEEDERSELAPGVAKGLAWTGYGGDVLYIEAVSWPGKGRISITGKLGQVMEESVKIAIDYVKSKAGNFGVDLKDLSAKDMHIHFPAGAIPKDGPSAGITIATAVISLLKGESVDSTIAMTGELTLTGEVLAIGGVREKVLAARRRGIRLVFLPEANRKDIKEIPSHMVKGLKFKFVKDYSEVYRVVFRRSRRKKPCLTE